MVRFEHVAPDGTELVFREPMKGDARALMSFINSFVDEPMSGLLIDKKVSLRDEEKWLESRLGEIRSRSTVMLLAERDGRIRRQLSHDPPPLEALAQGGHRSRAQA